MPTVPKTGFQHTVLNFFGYLAPWFEQNNEYTGKTRCTTLCSSSASSRVLIHLFTTPSSLHQLLYFSDAEKVLTIIVNSLPVHKLSDPASWALQEMSFHCRSHLVKYFHEIMSLLGRLERQGLTEDEMASISNAAVNILNEMPQESQLQCLKEICDIVRMPLQEITAAARTGQSPKGDNLRLIIWINHLAEVYKYLNVKSHKNTIVEIVHTVRLQSIFHSSTSISEDFVFLAVAAPG